MSALRSVVIAALASMSFAGAAYARDAIFTARLETPVAQQTRVIAQNTIWTCEGDTCRARADHASTVRACRQLGRELDGRIVAYGPEGDELTADEIARCNGDAVPAVQAAN
ncbi:MAG: hypothetical protein K2P58_04160 [Hyphomonadaceae bacterium]|nr:hypothetical protein [Hyphomonadaceae bacterium]